MITNNSLREYYVKLQGMYTQCYDMLKAINQSLSTRASEISVVVQNIQGESETVRIPSFLYLENKLEDLDSSFASIVNLPKSGEAWIENSENLYKLKMIKAGVAPVAPTLSSKSNNLVALFKDNTFLRDLVSPKTYLKVNLGNLSDTADSILMKKYIINTASLYQAINGIDNYNDFVAALYGYSKGNDYDEYESTLSVPVKRNRYSSHFNILAISEPWQEGEGSKLSYKVTLDGLEYQDSEDSSISYTLKINDVLCIDGESTTWKVKSVNTDDMSVVIEEIAGHTVLQTTEANSSMVLSVYDTDFSNYHYVEVPLEENPYICIFLSTIENGVRSEWSTPLLIDLNSIYIKDSGGNYIQDQYGNNMSYIEYYKKYCTNIGDLILGITETAYPQISNFTPSELSELETSTAMQVAVSNTFDETNILQVVPINKHLTDDVTNDEIKKLHASKNDFNQQISTLQTKINEVYNKLTTTDFSKETTTTQSALKTELQSYYTQRNSLQKQLSSIIDQINTKATDLKVTGDQVKYRVRGITVIDALQDIIDSIASNVDIIGCDVEYKYKSTTKDTTSINVINSSTFTDWNKLDNIDRQRELKFNADSTSFSIDFVDYNTTANIIKWNQIDIPIQQGEDVIIRLRYKLSIGQPFMDIYTPWSDEKTVVFPDQYTEDVDLTTILDENTTDTIKSAFDKTLIDDGYAEHIQDKAVSSDQTFFHTPEHIYSGFNTAENKMISLKDKLNDINGQIETWRTLLDNESNSKFEVWLTYDDYSILLSSNSKNVINIYNSDHLLDIFIKKKINIVIKNTGDVRVNLYSIFPGSTDTALLNCDIDAYKSEIVNYERVPLLISNTPKAQMLGQWVYFRDNSAWTNNSIYYTTSLQDSDDREKVELNMPLLYDIYPSQYMFTDNRQVLLGYRERQGTTHYINSSTNSSAVKWRGLMLDRSTSELRLKASGTQQDSSSTTTLSESNVASIYDIISKSNPEWYLYSNAVGDNKWLMRYEDIVAFEHSAESKDRGKQMYLDDSTTFKDFTDTYKNIANFNDNTSFVGGFLYPDIESSEYLLTEGKEKSSKYIEVGESLTIPLSFEYYVDSNKKKISKSIYFDLRNSLVRDPLHYMVEIVGNYDYSSNGNIYLSDNNYTDSAANV